MKRKRACRHCHRLFILVHNPQSFPCLAEHRRGPLRVSRLDSYTETLYRNDEQHLQEEIKKARLKMKAEIRGLIKHSGSTPMKDLVEMINAKLSGWVNYFRVGN